MIATTQDSVAEAARILRNGGLVAFPTETVYGLGADATQGTAVAKVYAVKGRPSFNPLIVHVAAAPWVAEIALPDKRFDLLAHRFWPGPLTFVMHRRPGTAVSELVSAGLDTVAVRSPAHDIAHALLEAVGRPLAAPSANKSGTVSPTRAEHVIASLGDQVDLVLNGGPCRVGLESTVLDLTGAAPAILRPGAITADEITAVLGKPVSMTVAEGDSSAPRSPGQLASHYAPELPLRLNAKQAEPGEALLAFGTAPSEAALNLSPGGDLIEAAANLFAMLRALDDKARYRAIAVMPIPEAGIGVAINDRLRRAAAPRG
ncbi:MAG: threonylcarbamoyl-AMP synthase [Rhodospirillaceae bacterium]|nr:MAG: threonylcarbamoyl-AMP synthase [Rhodospirillaceae bacterium]